MDCEGELDLGGQCGTRIRDWHSAEARMQPPRPGEGVGDQTPWCEGQGLRDQHDARAACHGQLPGPGPVV